MSGAAIAWRCLDSHRNGLYCLEVDLAIGRPCELEPRRAHPSHLDGIFGWWRLLC